jgi:glycosyltransferase involved in cell wall biosynthesis
LNGRWACRIIPVVNIFGFPKRAVSLIFLDSMATQLRTVAFLAREVHCNDGVASNCETLIDGLNRLGWRVVFISGAIDYDANSERRYRAMHEQVAHWEVLEGLNTLRPSLAHVWRARDVLRKYGVSTIHAHGFGSLPMAWALKLLSGVRTVATFHPSVQGGDPSTMVAASFLSGRSRKYRILLRAFRPKAIIASSVEITEWLRSAIGVPAGLVHHIPLGIDSDLYRPPSPEERAAARAALGIDPQQCVFLLTGRLSWNKGHDLLIDATRIAHARMPAAGLRVIFAGSGDQEDEIKAYAFREDDDRRLFTFLGFVDDLRAVYWASDVFVLPSRSEGFGLVVAEAMCAGLLPVRTPGGGARDQIVEGDTGFIVPFDDPAALAEVMIKLVGQPDRRNQIAGQATQRGRSLFSRQRMAEASAALYD